jgi:3-oxoacyl-(acyl-carrier-protein) synthase
MPEGDQQAEAIKQAYANANRDPSSAFYVELHATGTAVGDPIEANAAGKIFSKGRDPSKILRSVLVLTHNSRRSDYISGSGVLRAISVIRREPVSSPV